MFMCYADIINITVLSLTLHGILDKNGEDLLLFKSEAGLTHCSMFQCADLEACALYHVWVQKTKMKTEVSVIAGHPWELHNTTIYMHIFE